jgi:hypothetical protein
MTEREKEIDPTAIDEIIDPKLVKMIKRNYPEIYAQSVKDGATISDLIGMIIVRLDQMVVESMELVKQAEARLDNATEEEETHA